MKSIIKNTMIILSLTNTAYSFTCYVDNDKSKDKKEKKVFRDLDDNFTLDPVCAPHALKPGEKREKALPGFEDFDREHYGNNNNNNRTTNNTSKSNTPSFKNRYNNNSSRKKKSSHFENLGQGNTLNGTQSTQSSQRTKESKGRKLTIGEIAHKMKLGIPGTELIMRGICSIEDICEADKLLKTQK